MFVEKISKIAKITATLAFKNQKLFLYEEVMLGEYISAQNS